MDTIIDSLLNKDLKNVNITRITNNDDRYELVKTLTTNESTYFFKVPRLSKLNTKEFILLVRSNETNEILSMIYLSIGDHDKYINSLMICYCYTPLQFRRNGYNSILIKTCIDISAKLGLNDIIIVPFDGSHSIPMIEKMGFVKSENLYHLKTIINKNDNQFFKFM